MLEQPTFKTEVISGIYWNIIESIGRNFFRVVIALILARLLDPSDYGLVGMVTIFITLGGVLVDSGLGMALIQNKNSESEDFSTVFLFNIGAGLTIYLILFFAAPLIAGFFEQPILIIIIRVVSLNFVITSFGMVQNSIFSKRMNFKVLTKISLLSILISGTVSIVLAYLGFGVWTLIIQGLMMTSITSCLLWFFSEWKPSLAFDKDRFKKHYRFGSKLMYANIINTIFQNIYLITIGKVYSTRQLGFYTKSEGIAKAPVQNIYTIFQKVFFPAFSLIQDDNVKLKFVFKKVLKVSGYIIFPIMLGLVALSKPFILFILTDKWSGSIPYLQLLCLTFILYPFHALNINILNVKGRSDLVLKLEYFKKGIIILGILLTFKLGIVTLIIGQILSSLVAFYINTYYSGELINYPVSEQIKDLLPYLVLSVVTALLLFIPLILLGEKHLLQMVIQLSFGTIFYLAVSKWFNFAEYFETRDVLRQFTLSFISRFKK